MVALYWSAISFITLCWQYINYFFPDVLALRYGDQSYVWAIRFAVSSLIIVFPVFILVSILTILGTMQIYDLIVSTTGGGPGYETEVPMTRIVAIMLGNGKLGYACSMGVIFGLFLLILSLVQMKIGKWLEKD